MARTSLGKSLPKSHQKDKERERPAGTLNLGLGRFRDKVLGLGRTDLWSDLTSRVKSISKLRLNQDNVKGSLRELGEWSADRLAHSAGNIWWPAQLSSVECYGLGRCGRVMGGYGLVGSWHELPRVRQLGVAFSINRESLAQKMARTSLGKSLPKSHQKDKERKRLAAMDMDTRQRDKEKDKERDVPPGEQTPKVSGVDCKGRSGPADEPYGLVQGTLNLGLGRFRDKVLGLGRTDLWSDLTSRLTGADRLAHSAGNSWWPAQLSSVECYGPGRCGRVMGGYGLVGSWHEPPRVRQLGVAFSINKESLAQKMARNSLGKALPKSHQKDKERERPAVREENCVGWCCLAGVF
ncbi:hypothetical protein F2Q70_00001988 [Brassica cretica]|uniref:Uncharacterized protein n=1 Tax=Brassica cretica TaxID=69181 RepID=A0A8S9ITD4_BRACR|nr:hypothetical protein F2Q70_00001988 [Brassica cretica]